MKPGRSGIEVIRENGSASQMPRRDLEYTVPGWLIREPTASCAYSQSIIASRQASLRCLLSARRA